MLFSLDPLHGTGPDHPLFSTSSRSPTASDDLDPYRELPTVDPLQGNPCMGLPSGDSLLLTPYRVPPTRAPPLGPRTGDPMRHPPAGNTLNGSRTWRPLNMNPFMGPHQMTASRGHPRGASTLCTSCGTNPGVSLHGALYMGPTQWYATSSSPSFHPYGFAHSKCSAPLNSLQGDVFEWVR